MAAFLRFPTGLIQRPFASNKLLVSRTLPVAICNDRKEIHKTSVRFGGAVAEKSHSAHWIAERAVAMSLFAVLPAAYFLPPSFAMDTALTTSLVLHAHWGIAGVFTDYLHGYPSNTGERRYPLLTTVSKLFPYVLSITAFACLTSFNYNDVGLVKAITMLWDV